MLQSPGKTNTIYITYRMWWRRELQFALQPTHWCNIQGCSSCLANQLKTIVLRHMSICTMLSAKPVSCSLYKHWLFMCQDVIYSSCVRKWSTVHMSGCHLLFMCQDVIYSSCVRMSSTVHMLGCHLQFMCQDVIYCSCVRMLSTVHVSGCHLWVMSQFTQFTE